jgi:hypothetical protein
MKLQELAVVSQTTQAAKVVESYFGNRLDFNNVDGDQARRMLKRVRTLVAEHRRTTEFHSSEQNPAYLKLVVMEQALSARIMELAATDAVATDPATVAQNRAATTLQQQQRRRQLQDEIKALQAQLTQKQKELSSPVMEASEVQQAQVVLASQDMVDQVQKMSEQISAMQFKDLPALVDQIKNEVGVDQAMQFNTDTTAALAGLLQNLQGAKTQLESALGVVTGQAPQVPGDALDGTAELGGELPSELPAPGEEEIETDIETDIDVDDDKDSNSLAASLGRDRR